MSVPLGRVSPSTAAQLAAGSVAFVEKRFGFALPYTPESLLVVDALIDKIKATGATQRQASGLLSGLGCYAGEVFVRHARATWRSSVEMGMAPGGSAAVVVLPGMTPCDAIASVFQRFTAGGTESVAALYERIADRTS